MDAIQDSDFFEMVRSYVRGEISLDELDQWIVERLPSFAPPRQDAVSELAGLIQLSAFEVSQGHRDAQDVRSLVEEYLRRREPIVVSYQVGVHPESASTNVPIPIFTGWREVRVLSFSHR